MFDRVLIANRGEIACRIIRTLRRLGVGAVAIYTEADRGAKHIGLADAAILVPSYLDIAAITRAAVDTSARAIHPGYGFLSENVEFARACAEAGVVFVGPSIDAIETMGDKIHSKEHVAARGVAVIPGAGVAGMSDVDLVEASAGVGFPLLIKPSAGGGGKGMTIVESAADLPAALEASRRVAMKSFGDDTLLLERLVRTPRHIEVQVLADSAGHTIHLGERECSLQRRHQKIIEEAPSALLDANTRAAIGEAACEVARSVLYVGAGTVEFLISDENPGEFFFMEMNTRLQVEHPVTELVTGLDLVEWQLRIAAGEPLTIKQDDVRLDGHAIEARLYAEDPAAGFLPSTGTIVGLREPHGDGVRVDGCLEVGSVVASDYDPMLAKIIAWGEDRDQALARLDAALAETVVQGVSTNVAFLRGLLADDAVRAGRLDTGLIERSLPVAPSIPDAAAQATAALLEHHTRWPQGSPWAQPTGWRLGPHRPPTYHVGAEVGADSVTVDGTPERAVVTVGGVSYETRFSCTPTAATIEIEGYTTTFAWARDPHALWINNWRLVTPTRAEGLAEHRASLTRVAGAVSPEVRSVMPGTVVALGAATGDVVAVGHPIVTIEAMKMEHTMLAPVAGVVTITVASGDQVRLDQVVASIEPPANPHEGAAP